MIVTRTLRLPTTHLHSGSTGLIIERMSSARAQKAHISSRGANLSPPLSLLSHSELYTTGNICTGGVVRHKFPTTQDHALDAVGGGKLGHKLPSRKWMEARRCVVLPYIACDHVPGVMLVLERDSDCDHRAHHLWHRTTITAVLRKAPRLKYSRFPSLPGTPHDQREGC